MQTKTPIGFWCRRGLNPISLIQPLETLPVKLTRTHMFLILDVAVIYVVIWCNEEWLTKKSNVSLLHYTRHELFMKHLK